MCPLLLALVLGACSVCPPGDAEATPSHVAGAAALKGKTVALVQADGLGSVVPFCTGVWVSGRSILTALHCAADEEPLIPYVTYDDAFPRGATTPDLLMMPRGAIVYLADEEHDLALLRAFDPPAGHGVAYLRIGTIPQGTFAQAMGHSLGMWWSYSSGDVASVRQMDLGDGAENLWIQSTAPISPGNSGGGLFDSTGSLMGIAHATTTKGQNLNFFVHTQYIAALLAKAKAAGKL